MVVILLLNVMEVLSVAGGALLDRPCMVLSKMFVCICHCSVHLIVPAPNDTVYTRWSCHSDLGNPVQIMSTPPPPSMGTDHRFWVSRPCGPGGNAPNKAGDVETNPGPTTTHKQVCHRQYKLESRYR